MTFRCLLRRLLPAVVAAALLVTCIPVCLPAAAAPTAPIEVLGKEGTVLSVVEYGGSMGLYLPGYINRKQVTLRYTGTASLYCPRTKKYLAPGETAAFDLSAQSVRFYEKSASGEETSFSVLVMGGSAKVPSLYIKLGAGTTLSYLHQNKENKGTGTLRMLTGDGEKVYDGALDTIKGRGNTSFTQPGLAPDKKSYSIKLAKKAELVAGAGKAKKWALIHMRVCDGFDYDWTGLCNLLGYQTYAALVGEGYADIKAQFVDLYIDGEYRGAYILAERVAVNAALDMYDPEEYISSSSNEHALSSDYSDPAIKAGIQYFQYTADAVKKQNFDITGGYLLEVNTPKLEEPCGFETKQGMLVDIKAPEACTKEQVSYIARYFQLFENALYSETGYNEVGKHYSEYVDMDSLASLMLTCAFYKNWELFRTSTYMYMDTADSDHPKLTFGPAWDFETGATRFTIDQTLYSTHQLYVDTYSKCYNIIGQLSSKADFQQRMFEKQKELSKILEATLGSGRYNGITRAEVLWKEASASLDMNWARWNFKVILDNNPDYSWRNNTYAAYAETFLSALQTRWDDWKGLWNTKGYLLGLTVDSKPSALGYCTLTARVSGTADGYQWYRLGADNTLELLEDETKRMLTVSESGTYYCIAYGGNNAYYSGAKSDILSNPTIYMTSAPVRVDVVAKVTTSTTATSPSGEAIGTTQPSGESNRTEPGENTSGTPTGGTTTPTSGGEGSNRPNSTDKEQPAAMPLIFRILLVVAVCGGTCAYLVWSEGHGMAYWMYYLMKKRRNSL